jgi:hypothetical protein
VLKDYFCFNNNIRRNMEYFEDAVVTTGQEVVKSKRAYYPSNKHNKFICNAVTGVPYPWRVGSKESRFLYKTVDSTGTCDEDGRLMRKDDVRYPNRNPNHLYYDSPEQFMRHSNIKLDPAYVQQWHSSRQHFE